MRTGVAVRVLLVGDLPALGAPALDIVDRLVLTGADGVEHVVGSVAEHGPAAVAVALDGATGDGVAVVAALTARAPQVPVLAVARHAEHAALLAAVRAGAAGYVLRAGHPDDLVDAIVRTAAGDAVFSPGLAQVALEEHGRLAGAEPARLTEREADVLRLIVEGLTARQIATRLVLSPRTVENHVQHVLRKLQVHNRAALVRYAIEHGLA